MLSRNPPRFKVVAVIDSSNNTGLDLGLDMSRNPPRFKVVALGERWLREREQIERTQAEPQWIVAQRLLSALTIPGSD